MSNPLTRGDMARRLTSEINGLDADEARRRINRAYLNEAMGHPWSFLLKRFTLQTEASYATGTVQVTGTTVQGTSTVWVPSWVTSPSVRSIAIQGRTEPYDVSAIADGDTLTIADTWLGSADAGLTYVMWRDKYPLPGDCGYAKLMALYDPEQRFRLEMRTQFTFLRDWIENPQLTNIPDFFMMESFTTETPPRARMWMYPAPSTVRVYFGFYFARPDFMTADADYPRWPHECHEMIPLSALIEHYSTPRFYSPKYLGLYKPLYADMFRKMVRDFDGNPALDIVIEDISTGRGRSRSNAHWSPNVMSFVGTEMTRS